MAKHQRKHRGLRWFLTIISLLFILGVLTLLIAFRFFYRRELCPWLPPQTRLWSWRFEGLEQAALALFDFCKYGESDYRRKKLIALTFDDGPYPLYTPLLLDILQHYNVKATFFVVGIHLREYPALARKIVDEGHEIANHTNRYRREHNLSHKDLREEVLLCEQAIHDVTGQYPRCFRPAGGNLSLDGITTLQSLGYTCCNATVNAGDWWQRDPDKLIEWSFHGRSREGVVLMHSGALGTIKALPGYINSLKAKGFQFTTLAGLARHTGAPLPELPKRTHKEKLLTGGPDPEQESLIPEASDEHAP